MSIPKVFKDIKEDFEFVSFERRRWIRKSLHGKENQN